MQIPKLTQNIQAKIAENASVLLTATGVVGVVTTGVLSGRAGIRAANIIEAEEMEINTSLKEEYVGKSLPLTKQDVVKLTWKEWVPPVATGTATITAIIFAHRVNATKAAALVAAYGVSQDQFKEYREKAEEKLGLKKERAMRDEINQDRVNEKPASKQTIIVAGGNVLCLDATSGRYFRTSVEKIEKAVNATNAEIRNHMTANLSFFYSEMEWDTNAMSDLIGWNDHAPCEHYISTTIADNDEPCLVLEFVNPPFSEFARDYRG